MCRSLLSRPTPERWRSPQLLPMFADRVSSAKKTVINRGYSVRCCQCLCWAHRASEYHPASEPAKVFGRYVDDILRSVKMSEIASLVETANKLHPNLEFAKNLEIDGALPFLDMLDVGDESKW